MCCGVWREFRCECGFVVEKFRRIGEGASDEKLWGEEREWVKQGKQEAVCGLGKAVVTRESELRNDIMQGQ